MSGPRILLIIGGGIAAYKSCELVRLIRKSGGDVTCVITEGGQQFVTPMALAALSGNKVYTSLFDLKDEVEMGHIQLSREADLVVVCPATADLLAKMAAGIADDLATTLILATDKPVLTVPAMNVRMWEHGTTKRNAEWLRQAGVTVMEPDEGEMACGEWGPGRLPEPVAILSEIARELSLDITLPEPTPAKAPALAAPAKTAAKKAVDEVAVEALEPEDEGEGESATAGKLSSLLSAIIPRSTAKRSHDDIDAELDALPELDPFDAEGLLRGTPIEPATDFEPLPDGPLLAKKGKAASAPPTDREAINHEVARQDAGARPQPLPGDVQPIAIQAAELAVDSLGGPVEFDTDPEHRPLHGKHVIVTAGPTWEPIDPVRYIANRSSGKQGYAIAAMAAAAGARVTLISGPVSLATPLGVERVDVESADEMAEAVRRALPADAAFMVAAVADWKSRHVAGEKMKKRGSAPPALILTENPDILATLAGARKRPKLLIGFAAETENVIDNAKSKRKRKGADWIVANDVSHSRDGPGAGGGVMGGDTNHVHIVTSGGVEELPEMGKQDVARELVRRAAEALAAEPVTANE
jgi:phosphopantothenoylcysteine decarboxylase/phosphopantothenate--cysteine ligase